MNPQQQKELLRLLSDDDPRRERWWRERPRRNVRVRPDGYEPVLTVAYREPPRGFWLAQDIAVVDTTARRAAYAALYSDSWERVVADVALPGVGTADGLRRMDLEHDSVDLVFAAGAAVYTATTSEPVSFILAFDAILRRATAWGGRWRRVRRANQIPRYIMIRDGTFEAILPAMPDVRVRIKTPSGGEIEFRPASD